jgi:hypothetical protein
LSSHVATAIQTPPWFGGIVSTKIGQVNLNTPEKGKKKALQLKESLKIIEAVPFVNNLPGTF